LYYIHFNEVLSLDGKRTGSIVTVTKELSKHKLDLVGVQEVRWEGGGTEPAGNAHVSMEMEMRIMN
jgi:hypothetical protein